MNPKITINYLRIGVLLILSCTVISSCSNFSKILKYPRKKNLAEGKPFIYDYKINLDIKGITNDEKKTILSRLQSQVEDSAKVITTDKLFLFQSIKKPIAFDSNAIMQSAYNMKSSLLHLGYYNAATSWSSYIDTTFKKQQQRTYVTYHASANKPVRIESVVYNLRKADMQKIADDNKANSLLKINEPVTKANVLGEIGRLVEIYRNNGYYKFSTDELRVRGDTTIEALTNISDDPFEQIEQLQKAQAKRDSPTIKLGVVLNTPTDSSKIKQYRVRHIYIYTDYILGAGKNDSAYEEMVPVKKCDTCKAITGVYLRSHYYLYKNNFITKNLSLYPGDILKQDLFYKTLNNFNRAGVWASANMIIEERKDKSYTADIIVQLVPARQFDFESSLEFSYSANSNTNSLNVAPSGNLFGIIANATLNNRNWLKQGIHLSNSLSTGVELNLKNKSTSNEFINSNDIRYNLTVAIPNFIKIIPSLKLFPKVNNKHTLINFSTSYVNRIALFKLLNGNLSYALTFNKNDWQVALAMNYQYSNLYNETILFTNTLAANPYLKYAFNTSLVAGPSLSLSKTFVNKNKSTTLTSHLEFSNSIFTFNTFTKYLKTFAKVDISATHSISNKKSAFVFRSFVGIGIPKKSDTTLPFFKQYFGGGSNSMRGWPVRGIGLGAQAPKDYGTSAFNDRTGDVQVEMNAEYRHDLFKAFGDLMFFKSALFFDAGNVWNWRNSTNTGIYDPTQFKVSNIYKELGMSVGAGLRIDFKYAIIRLDMGFRIKKPELGNTIAFPPVKFNNIIPKIFSGKDAYRRWRYENYNFTLGINYPF